MLKSILFFLSILTRICYTTLYKYITVYLTPYNEVGDEVFCTIGSHSTYGIEITGPFAVGESWNGYSDGMWYNLTIVSARVAYVTVDYMDGTKEWFDEADIHAGMVNVTVAFDSNLGGAGLLAYDMDGERQAVIPRGQSATHQMPQGTHTLTIKSLLLGKEYTFTAQSDTTIDVYGKSFGFDITER